MKPGLKIWLPVLLITHAAVFLAARHQAGNGPPSRNAGLADPAAPRTKFSERRDRQPAGAHAGLLDELLASDASGVEFDQGLAAIFRDMIERDLRGALALVYGPEAGTRYEAVAGKLDAELKREIVARSAAVGQWISSGYFGSRHAEVAELWAGALVAGGRRELVVEALPGLPALSRAAAIDCLAPTAKAPELAILRQWMNPEAQDRLDDYAQRTVRFAAGDLALIFAGEEDPKVLKTLCDAYKARYLDPLPGPEAIAASRQLPEGYRQDVMLEVAGNPGPGGIEAFTAVLAEMDRLSLWEFIFEGDEDGIIDSAIGQACSRFSLPSEVFAQLCEISRPATRLAALRSAGGQMAGSGNEAQLAAAVEALPRGLELDAFVEGLWSKLHLTDDPDFVAALAECVSDPGLRERLRETTE
jgi:hypothetical protein